MLVSIIQEHRGIDVQAGRLALSAAVYTDVFAWFALALVLTLQFGGTVGLFESVIRGAALALYTGLMLLVVRPWLKKRIIHIALGERSRVGIALVYCLFSAQVTAMLGFHHAIGAVLAAYVFHDLYSMEQAWRRWIGRFGHLFLAPIFLPARVSRFRWALSPNLVFGCGCFCFCWGTVGKVLGSYIGARASGLKPKVSIEVGVLMNTKGLVELVILGVGLQAGCCLKVPIVLYWYLHLSPRC